MCRTVLGLSYMCRTVLGLSYMCHIRQGLLGSVLGYSGQFGNSGHFTTQMCGDLYQRVVLQCRLKLESVL